MKRDIFYILAAGALLMNFMAQITPLWLPGLDGPTIQICSTQGIKTITLDENGDPVPETPEMDKPCTFCTARAFASLEPVRLQTPLPVNFHRAEPSATVDLVNSKPLPKQNLSRGPPTYS